MSRIDHAIKKYQQGVSLLIDELGKDVRLFFKKKIAADEGQFDAVRPGSLKTGHWTHTESETSFEESSEDIIALVQYNPKDFETYDVNLDRPKSIVRLKTYSEYLPSLQRCEYIIPEFSKSNLVYQKYKLVRPISLFGLKESKYCTTYWEAI